MGKPRIKTDANTDSSKFKQHGTNNFMANKSDREVLEVAFINGKKNLGILLKKREGKIDDSQRMQFVQEIIPKVKVPLCYSITKEGFMIISEVNDIKTALKILNIRTILGQKITSKVLIGKLCSKFVICGVNPNIFLKDVACILEGDGIKVIGIRRFLKQKNGKLLPTYSVVVTQIGHSIPYCVKLFNKSHMIRSYEERPLFCKRCLKYGHREKFCSHEVACNNCGQEHYYVGCTVEMPRCKNCLKRHPADSHDCTFFEKEVKIVAIKNKLHLSREEAVHKFQNGEYSTICDESNQMYDIVELFKDEMSDRLEKMSDDITEKLEKLMQRTAIKSKSKSANVI